jgi:hypothetical protein
MEQEELDSGKTILDDIEKMAQSYRSRFGHHGAINVVLPKVLSKQVSAYVQTMSEGLQQMYKVFGDLNIETAPDEPKKPNKQYYLQYNSRRNGKNHDRASARNSHIRSDPGFSRKHSRQRAHPRRG